MKILITLSVVFFISCKSEKIETIIIVSGKDSIKIETNGNYHLTHLGSPCGSWGHNDTITGVFTLRFMPCGIGITPEARYDSALKYHKEVVRFGDSFMLAKKKHKPIKELYRWHDSTIKYHEIQKTFRK